MKQMELSESNHILRSRVIELESLLQQQQNLHSESSPILSPQQEVVHLNSDAVKLQTQNLKLSEELIELQTRCDYATAREKSLIKLVEVLRNNEPKIELEISAGIQEYQQQVEEKYFQDLKDLTETYEAEKQALASELEKLTELYRNGGFHQERSDGPLWIRTETIDDCTQTEFSFDPNSTFPENFPSPPISESVSEPHSPLKQEEIASHGSNDAPLDLSAKELKHLLDLEILRSRAAQEQIAELETILEAQRSSFRKHLARERDVAMTVMDGPTSDSEMEPQDNMSVPSITSYASIEKLKEIIESFDQPSSADQRQSNKQQSLHILEEIQRRIGQKTVTHNDDGSKHQLPAADNLIPDWYFEVLRKLRQRVSHLESIFPEKSLTSAEERFSDDLWSKDNQLSEIKTRYEDALQNVQTALEEQTQLAKDQIGRLEEIIRTAKVDQPSNLVNQKEVSRLQSLLNQSTQEIAYYKEKVVEQEKSHADELHGVWSHFQKYREAQDLLTLSLEDETRARGELERWYMDENPDASSEFHELSTLCEIKRSSLRAVLDALAVVAANTTSEGYQRMERLSLREELLEARLASAENEASASYVFLSPDEIQIIKLHRGIADSQRGEEGKRKSKKGLADFNTSPLLPLVASIVHKAQINSGGASFISLVLSLP
jgi:hypothetical protein